MRDDHTVLAPPPSGLHAFPTDDLGWCSTRATVRGMALQRSVMIEDLQRTTAVDEQAARFRNLGGTLRVLSGLQTVLLEHLRGFGRGRSVLAPCRRRGGWDASRDSGGGSADSATGSALLGVVSALLGTASAFLGAA